MTPCKMTPMDFLCTIFCTTLIVYLTLGQPRVKVTLLQDDSAASFFMLLCSLQLIRFVGQLLYHWWRLFQGHIMCNHLVASATPWFIIAKEIPYLLILCSWYSCHYFLLVISWWVQALPSCGVLYISGVLPSGVFRCVSPFIIHSSFGLGTTHCVITFPFFLK